MHTTFYSRFALSAIFALSMFACTNDQNSTETKESDSTTTRSATTSFDASRSVTLISPDLYKQLADTMNIRIVQGIYKPGDSSIMHAHPDFAMYVIEGSTIELTASDGSKQNIEFKKDMAVVLPADTHSAKNIGNSTLNVIVVEVNRPRE